jgi:hypothetical protein
MLKSERETLLRYGPDQDPTLANWCFGFLVAVVNDGFITVSFFG